MRCRLAGWPEAWMHVPECVPTCPHPPQTLLIDAVILDYKWFVGWGRVHYLARVKVCRKAAHVGAETRLACLVSLFQRLWLMAARVCVFGY